MKTYNLFNHSQIIKGDQKLNIFNHLILMLSIFLLYSCSKSVDPFTTNNNSIDTYKFSDPQSIRNLSTDLPKNGNQILYITKNKIFTRISSCAGSMSFGIYSPSYSTIGFSFPNVGCFTFRSEIVPNSGCFAVDDAEQYLFVVAGISLFKCDLSTRQVTLIAADIGHGSYIKLLPDNNIILATDKTNGSILKIQTNTAIVQTLASNLGATPIAFDLLNNEIYFTRNSLTGGNVSKIAVNGTLSTVIDNLTDPTGIAFDNYGNMILETQNTIEGYNYRSYSLYTQDGKLITAIKDAQNYLILSGTVYGKSPFYVDNNNNLFFTHTDMGGGTISHCNPYKNGNDFSLYKIQLLKQ